MNTEIIPDLDFDEYRKIDRISASDLMKIAKDPALYHYSKILEIPETSAMNFGTKLHLALLEEEKFSSLEVAKTATSTRKGLIGKTEYIYISEIKKLIKSDEFLNKTLENSKKEISILWEYEELKLKSKLDLIQLNDDYAVILDLKTTCANNIRDVYRSILDYNYIIQAQTYIKATKLSYELKNIFFYFVFCTKTPPFNIFVFKVDTTRDEQFDYAINSYKNIKALNELSRINYHSEEDFDGYDY